MAFDSFEFLVFLGTVLLFRVPMRQGAAIKWLLLAASLCFYASWSLPCIGLLLVVSILDFSIGWNLGRSKEPAFRKRLMWLSLASNLGLLGFFKYTNFLLDNVRQVLGVVGWQLADLHYNIVLPPGISYFTFASLAYVIDAYYERVEPCQNLRDYALFVSFFPKLLSGPIARARDFLPQLKGRIAPSFEDVEAGVACFLQGAVKKLVIADQVAGNVGLIFSAPSRYDGFTLLQGALGYAVQLYCDFSGYSDMAVGCARIVGFRLPENFQMPYSSSSVTEFWRRWHITLSQWFRDYVFLPLEMATRNNPYGTLRAAINFILTMLLCGLWHGANWNFVIWGGIHGVALAVHKTWASYDPLAFVRKRPLPRLLWAAASRLLTLGVVTLSFVFFRSATVNDAFHCLSRIISWTHDGTRLVSPYILPAVGVVLLTHLLVHRDRNWIQELPQRSWLVRFAAYCGLVTLLVFLGATSEVPFIYFQF